MYSLTPKDLKTKKKKNEIYSLLILLLSYLYAEISSIDVIAEEEILGIGRGSAHFKQFHQIVKLSMDVATNCPFFFPRFEFITSNQPNMIHKKKEKRNNIYK